MRNNFKRFLSVALVLMMAFAVMTVSAFATEGTNVAKIGDTEYATLAAAIKVATAGDTITLLDDVTEDVTISKNLTINGAGKTYTGKMNLTNRADITIKNVNFEGKGNGYAVESKGAYYVTIEDCTAKNYYGFVQVASGAVLTTVKNVTVSNVTYGIKVDYSDEVTLENVTVKDAYVGLCDSNFGEKTYTITNCKFNAEMPVVIWERTGKSNVTTLNFVGVNDFGTDDYLYSVVQAEGNTIKLGSNYCVVNLPEVKVAAVGGNEYTTLAEAITAATKGDTITLLADVNENVTLSKNLTIDGNGNKYTGTMTVKDNLTVTVKNVNFVNGGVSKSTKSSKGTYKFADCTFDGEGKYAYPLLFKGANTITVDNCTVKDYLYGFLYVSSGTNKATVKNVTVEDCPSYAVYFGSGVNTATFENLTVKNSDSGFVINNAANRSFTIKNCNMENVGTAINHSGGTKTITCTANGVNDFGGAALSQYVKLNAAAQIGTKIYDSLMTAVADAKDGDVIKVVADTTIASDEAVVSGVYGAKYKTFIEVLDKNITIDFNGKKVTINPTFDGTMLAAIFVGNTGALTLKDSSEAQTGGLYVNAAENTYTHSFLFVDQKEARLYIESGNYYINRVDYQSMLYIAQTGTGFISGGNFAFGNVPADASAQPWMFNTVSNGVNYVEVTGGTYNAYPQNNWNEVRLPYCYKIVDNSNGTYSVAYAPSVVIGDAGYESLTDAVAAAKDGDVITVVADHELENSDAVIAIADYDMYAYMSVTDKKITIDLNGKTITANPSFDKVFYGVLVVNGTGDVTLVDSSEDKTGAINVTVAEGTESYSMLSTDGATSKLTINSGNYYIDRVDKGYSMIYIAQTGTGYINGGNFVLGNAKTMVREGVPAPWIFNTWQNGKNVVYVNGGTYNTDPEHHWGEAKFKKGYVSAQDENGVWGLVRGPIIVEQPTDITVGYNKMGQFAPVIKGDGLTYTWYYKDTNTRWYTSTLTTATYDIKGLASRDGRQVYCVATDSTGKSVTTEIATLHVVPNEELAIVSQPTVVEGTLDKNVSVALEVTGDDLTYVWYYSDNGGKSYYKSSLTTATYDIILKEERMGRKVYCEITDAFGDTVKSDVITIKAVQSVELKLLSAPVYEAPAVGKTAKITLDVQGEGLKYTWYYSLPGKTTFYKSSITDSEYKLTLSEDRIGRKVYCVITDAFGNSVQTETVTLYAAV